MNKLESSEIIKEFIDNFFWVKLLHDSYRKLFDDKIFSNNIQKHANDYFIFLSELHVNMLILSHARLFDPAESFGKPNISVNFIIEKIEWSPDEKTELLEIHKKCSIFIEKIKPARNKMISHIDQFSVLTKLPLGVFNENDDIEFMENMELFCAKINYFVSGKQTGKMIVNSISDVSKFKKLIMLGIIAEEFDFNETIRSIKNEYLKRCNNED